MHKINIGLIGGTGKMGQQIIKKTLASSEFCLKAIFARQPMNLTEQVDVEQVFQTSDVVIDFSNIQFMDTVLSRALQYKKPLVIGITGLSAAHYQQLASAATMIPVVYGANMSVGIALLKKAVQYFAQKLDDSFDRDIVEFHHRYKKDAPSGTSLALAQCLSAGKTSADALHCSPLTKRPEGAIAVSVVHAGGILADQQVHFTSDAEHIILSHRCLDRGVYAEGALKAAQWILDKAPGLYTMDNVLGLTEWIA